MKIIIQKVTIEETQGKVEKGWDWSNLLGEKNSIWKGTEEFRGEEDWWYSKRGGKGEGIFSM